MTRRRMLGVLMVFLAVVLASLWIYVRSNPYRFIRLELLFCGYPWYELRQEGIERPAHAKAIGVPYVRSVYAGGEYVGCIDRYAMFQSVAHDSWSEPPAGFWVAEVTRTVSPFVAGLLGFAGILFLRRSANKSVQGTAAPPGGGSAVPDL